MKRNKFSLSHYKLFSCNMGNLVPCGLMEVLPGDSFQQASSALIRFSPLLAPLMHPVDARIHHWFVPHRLVWDDWEDFITGGPDGEDVSVFPTRTPSSAPTVGSLVDYLGYPADGSTIREWSMLPVRGYDLIWNEWYRDQDLQDEVVVSTAGGADTTTSAAIQSVAWEKDYFTSARPWPQKGPDITLPLGSTAPVTVSDGAGNVTLKRAPVTTENVQLTNTGTGNAQLSFTTDLSGATAVSVNDVREAFALQRYQEARARYGSRYTEYLRYLGVRSSDARLQRPEYLGGGRVRVQTSEIVQTAPDASDESFVGSLKGHGIGAMRSRRYRKFFEEHGYIFSLFSVKPKTVYADGLARTFNRRTKEDFWQKELEHIGQQEVLNKEVYAKHASPDGVFGYQDRYDEYRRMESGIAGQFRTVLDFWHMARLFGASTPALNADFVKSVPTERIFADNADDVLWVMVNHSVQARRMLSKVGTSFIY